MIKLSNQIIDVSDDTDFSILKKIGSLLPTTEVRSAEKRASLQDHEFALTIFTKRANKLNKFPISDFDSTSLSNEYFGFTSQNLPIDAACIAAENIKTACVTHGIAPSKAVKMFAKTASANQKGDNVYYEKDEVFGNKPVSWDDPLCKFAEVSKITSNDTYAKYVFGTTEDVKTGAEYFDKFAEKMPVEYRHKYAAAVQRRACELGMDLDGKIEKYAGNAYSADLDNHICQRKNFLKEARMVAVLEKVASQRNEMTPSEFAKLLHDFDKVAGLAKYHGGYLTDPYMATFASKQNTKIAMVKTASGRSFSHDAIADLATKKYAKVKEYFGEKIAEEFKKHPQAIFDTFPNDVKEVIANIAEGNA